MVILVVYCMISLLVSLFIINLDFFDSLIDIEDGIMVKHIILGTIFLPTVIVAGVSYLLTVALIEAYFSKFGEWVRATIKRACKPIKNFMNIKITKKGD